MDRYYIGVIEESGKREVFASNEQDEPTPQTSGYDEVEGPFDTKQEAEESL